MMRRRPLRPIRRFPGRPISRAGHPPIPPKLQEANRLYKNGDYEAAARLYEELYEKGVERKIPQAPRLLIQAGFSWIKAEKWDRGIEDIKKCFSVWIERKKWQELHRTSELCFSRLEQEGYADESMELKNWLSEQIPENVKDSTEWNSPGFSRQKANKTMLPVICPQCGAPVNPRDVEWFEDEIAQCPFCDAILTNSN